MYIFILFLFFSPISSNADTKILSSACVDAFVLSSRINIEESRPPLTILEQEWKAKIAKNDLATRTVLSLIDHELMSAFVLECDAGGITKMLQRLKTRDAKWVSQLKKYYESRGQDVPSVFKQMDIAIIWLNFLNANGFEKNWKDSLEPRAKSYVERLKVINRRETKFEYIFVSTFPIGQVYKNKKALLVDIATSEVEVLASVADKSIKGSNMAPVVASMSRKEFVEKAAEMSFDGSSIPNFSAVKGLDLCVGICPDDYYVDTAALNDSAEVHVIGIYEPQFRLADGKPESGGVVIRVAKTKKPVILYLSSYESTVWKIETEKDAKIESIYYSAYSPSRVLAPSNVKLVPHHNESGGYTFKNDGQGLEGGEQLFKSIKELTKITPLSFQGSYIGKSFNVPFYKDPTIFDDILQAHKIILKANTSKKIEIPNSIIRDGFMKIPGGKSVAVGTLKAVTYAPATEKLYGVNDHDFFEIDPTTGSQKQIDPPAGYPRFSWLGGVVYDPTSKRILIASSWHAGHHHTWDPKKNDWKVYEISDDSGYSAMTYDEKTKRIWAIINSGLVVIDKDYKVIDRIPLRMNGALFRLNDGPKVEIAQMAFTDDQLFVFLPKNTIGTGSYSEDRNYVIHPLTGNVKIYGGSGSKETFKNGGQRGN